MNDQHHENHENREPGHSPGDSPRPSLDAAVESLRSALIGERGEYPLPIDELLERYVTGTATAVEREAVELDARLSPARAHALAELQSFAAQMRGYDWAALRARLDAISAAAEPAPAVRFARAWVERLAKSACSLAGPIRLRPLVLDHSTAEAQDVVLRQQLHFADDQALGSFSAEPDAYRLHIEHNTWPAGTLALLEIIGGDGEPILERFVVFKEDWERSALDVVVPPFGGETSTLRLTEIDSAGLTAMDAAAVEADCAVALETDAGAADAWRAWADALLATHPAHPVATAIAARVNVP